MKIMITYRTPEAIVIRCIRIRLAKRGWMRGMSNYVRDRFNAELISAEAMV